MVKKAFVISAILITIIIIVSIIISIVNLKTASPAVFRSVVSYDSYVNTIEIAPQNTTTDNDIPLISNMLKYEATITFSTVIVVIIFLLLFMGTKKSKGW